MTPPVAGKRSWLALHRGAVAVVLATATLNALVLRPEQEPASFYESLDLSTPESAVTTFVEAFADGDYLAAHMSLSASAQVSLDRSLNLLQYGEVIDMTDEGTIDLMRSELPTWRDGITAGEHVPSRWYAQEQLWGLSAEHDLFLVDLRGDVTIVDIDKEQRGEVDVVADVEGIDGQTVFRLREAPSGNWKVHQVIIPGGNEEQLPWSVPVDPEPENVGVFAEIMVPCPAGGFSPSQADGPGSKLVVEPALRKPRRRCGGTRIWFSRQYRGADHVLAGQRVRRKAVERSATDRCERQLHRGDRGAGPT